MVGRRETEAEAGRWTAVTGVVAPTRSAPPLLPSSAGHATSSSRLPKAEKVPSIPGAVVLRRSGTREGIDGSTSSPFVTASSEHRVGDGEHDDDDTGDGDASTVVGAANTAHTSDHNALRHGRQRAA